MLLHVEWRPILLIVVLSSGVSLQGQTPQGAVRGTVQDSSGARIAHASIILRARDASFVRKAETGDRGEFLADNLPPGNYQVVVTAQGFSDLRTDLRVVISSMRDITVTLRPVAWSERIDVHSAASSVTSQPLDVASAVHQGVIGAEDLANLPLALRSFANIAYLAPGTEPVEPSDPTKARITAVSTGGSSGLNNELSVDGADDSDDYIGGFLQNFSPDAIQEFAVRTAGEDADTGGTTAGSVVITTRRGSNEWRGEGAFYDRESALNARFPIENPPPNPKQPFSRQNYAGAIGGPVKQNKLWLFSSLEFVRENASIAYSPASIVQFDALAQLATDGLIPGVKSIPVPNDVPIPFRDYLGSVRFDWTQSPNSQWFLRGAEDSYLTRNNLVEQGTLPSTGLTTHNNYFNAVVSNSYAFSPSWIGTFVFGASELHLTQARNSALGFALQFPFTLTALTVSGHETFGDNQFATPITAFPEIRNQEKYQWRYDLGHAAGVHSLRFGANFIHEPVLGGELSANAETLYTFPHDPVYYTATSANLAQFSGDLAAGASATPAGDGRFSQNVQRLAAYVEDSWRIAPRLTFNYGFRYQTTFGLFAASGRSQAANPVFSLLPLYGVAAAIPRDDHAQFAPRIGIAYAPGESGRTVLRAGFGLFYNDLAQNGWVTALQAVNGGIQNRPPSYIDPNYKTPYALHATAGVQHAFTEHWIAGADYTHEEGNHGYRAYSFPEFNLYKSDNRSSYNALMLHLQGTALHRLTLIANYTLSHAQTWGCVLGELFDYVNGVCDPFHAFAPGDYGPSGEDVRHRVVLAGSVHTAAGIEFSTLAQAESARPFTITNASNTGRISIDGIRTTLDQFRGTPYVQIDVRVSRPMTFGENRELRPFVEIFNLLNRNNPGANYVTDASALSMVPASEAQSGNILHVCANPACSALLPIRSANQLRLPAGALGDFFGPGTTVGIPFAAQLGVRFTL
jgi:hypothetical protein